MAHLKRLVAPKTWPIKRKGAVFVMRQYPRVKPEYSIPLLVLLRDLLKMAKTSSEARRILRERNVLVNGTVRTSLKFAAALFDIVEIPKLKKKYIVTFDKGGKISLSETEKANHRLSRIENKTKVAGGKLQLNLFDGTNVLAASGEYSVGEVVKLSVPGNKPVGKLSAVGGAKVLVIGGAHQGETAAIKSLELKKIPKEVVLKGDSGEFRTRFSNIHLIE